MRDRKFKVWDLINKRWIRPWSLKLNIDGSILAVTEMDGLETYGMHQVEIVEYTGLCDKNGKEIYEGDIVRIFTMGGGEWKDEGHVETIEWHKAGFSRIWGEGNFPLWWLDEDTQKFEVIGNIYENPELL